MDDTYIDSSFLLKLYLSEAESALVDTVLRNSNGRVLVSPLTDVEVISSLHRRLSVKDGTLAAATYRTNRTSGLFGELGLDAEDFEFALQIAQQQAKTYKLKSLDILHLATALRHSVPALATFDKNLRDAAQALGLAVLPV